MRVHPILEQLTITVNGVNDAPVAVDDTDSTDEDTDLTVDVLANDTDVDGDDSPANFSLDSVSINSVTGLTGGGMGSVSEVNDELVFAPGSDFDELDSGDTATVTVDYTLSDDEGASDTGQLTITVNGVNDAPVAVDDTDSTDEDTDLTVDVLANDTMWMGMIVPPISP